MVVNGVDVIPMGPIEISEQEAGAYVKYLRDLHPGQRIKNIIVNLSDDEAAIDYTIEEPKFERIRRITGYLVGSIDRWNNAKRAEEHDRVKHKIEQ